MKQNEPGNNIDRREFLRLAAGGVLTVTAAGLAGCGGGNGGGGGSTDLAGSVRSINDFVNSVQTQPRDTRIQRIAAYLKTRNELASSGVNDAGIWAVYPDGVPLMILDNRQPDQLPPGVKSVGNPRVSRGAELPTPLRARLINAMGSAFVNEVPIVSPFLTANGYSVVTDPGTVDSLRGLAGDGVFYMSSHGGICQIPVFDANGVLQRDGTGKPLLTPSFGIWTSTKFDPANPNQYLADLRAGRLGLGSALANTVAGVNQNEMHYWITPAWVSSQMAFGLNSLVWFSACQSDSAASAAFVQACLAKKAGLYVGWTNFVSSAACVVAGRFIFDRLLGSNTSNPKENPPQRPFDYENVWQELHKQGLDTHPSSGPGGATTIAFSAPAGAAFGLLAPTIEYALVDESKDQAILKGTFGTPDPSQRAVLIGGLEATVQSWAKDKIVCDLPRTGTGSSGDVVVYVRAHKSNVRRITEWDIHLRYHWSLKDTPPLAVDGAFKARFRADVGDYRETPGVAPKKPIRSARLTSDSGGPMEASGSHSDGDCTTTWSDQVQVQGTWGNPNATYILVCALRVDTDTKQGAIGIALGSLAPKWFTQTIACPNGTQTAPLAPAQSILGGVEKFLDPTEQTTTELPIPGLPLTFGNDFSLTAGKFIDAVLDLTLEWDAVTPISPPDPSAARSVKR